MSIRRPSPKVFLENFDFIAVVAFVLKHTSYEEAQFLPIMRIENTVPVPVLLSKLFMFFFTVVPFNNLSLIHKNFVLH